MIRNALCGVVVWSRLVFLYVLFEVNRILLPGLSPVTAHPILIFRCSRSHAYSRLLSFLGCHLSL